MQLSRRFSIAFTITIAASLLSACGDVDEGHAQAHDGHAHSHDGGASHDHDHGATQATVVSHYPITDKGFGECTCDEAAKSNGWCRRCGIGRVAGRAVPSAALYEALDAHGHDFIASSIACEGCVAAIEHDGFCEDSGMGFHGNLLYVSRLTHSTAKGELVKLSSVTCETCRAHRGGTGWCDACGGGTVGNLAFDDRAEYEVAAVEFERLDDAVATLDRCEICAIVMFTGGECRKCAAALK